jgi:hypothetical protein
VKVDGLQNMEFNNFLGGFAREKTPSKPATK